MCGICGFFSNSYRFSQKQLVTMTNALEHRGPDARGFFFSTICGLGHRRLSVIDLSINANQPMYSRSQKSFDGKGQDERFVIVYNGEVYNYQELAGELDVEMSTTSDTEVILELFVRDGVDFVNKLNGMFAIAIYDQLEKKLYLFRDRIGIKPLYYYWDGCKLLFASELKSLQCLDLNLQLDHDAVADFLHIGYIPAPRSIYKNIFKLQPGNFLIADNSGIKVKKYWCIDDKIIPSCFEDESYVLSELNSLLKSSIQYRLVSDVSLGVFLSGGIDSSLIAAVASHISSEKINTFSIGFKESAFDESNYARQVAGQLKTNHHEFIVTAKDAQELIPVLLDVYDEPFADSSAIPSMLVSQLAKKYVTVVLGGDGGDELFWGYGRYDWSARLSKPGWKIFRRLLSRISKFSPSARYQKAAQLLKYPNSNKLPLHILSQDSFFFSEEEISGLLLKSRFQIEGINTYFSNVRTFSAIEKQVFFEMESYLPDDLLVKIDRATMKYSLEARVPLLDHRLVEFAANISPALKLKNGERKYLLKQVLYGYLPANLFDRPKWGFSIPLIEWLKNDLRYLIDDYLNKNVIDNCGIVRYKAVHDLKEKFFAGHSYLYNRLWVLIVLHRFLLSSCRH